MPNPERNFYENIVNGINQKHSNRINGCCVFD